MKPFLKWAGGKYRQLPQIQPFLVGNRLIEPFVGAGSVFMNAGFDKVAINDVNPDLCQLYLALIHNGDYVLNQAKKLHEWCNSEARYNQLRANFNSGKFNSLSKAVFFLVLNRTGFNGLCRYNKKKEFNVPWGQKEQPYFPEQELRDFINSGLKPTVAHTDFMLFMNTAQEGNVVFCDPPYEPMPKHQGFTSYSGTSFKWGDQKRLVGKALELKARGVRVVITNSSAPRLVDLYTKAGFDIHPLTATRSISAKAESREVVKDIIAVLKP